MIMESKKIKFLHSNFVSDIKVLPFSQCVGKNYSFSNIPQIFTAISQLGSFSAKMMTFSEAWVRWTFVFHCPAELVQTSQEKAVT